MTHTPTVSLAVWGMVVETSYGAARPVLYAIVAKATTKRGRLLAFSTRNGGNDR